MSRRSCSSHSNRRARSAQRSPQRQQLPHYVFISNLPPAFTPQTLGECLQDDVCEFLQLAVSADGNAGSAMAIVRFADAVEVDLCVEQMDGAPWVEFADIYVDVPDDDDLDRVVRAREDPGQAGWLRRGGTPLPPLWTAPPAAVGGARATADADDDADNAFDSFAYCPICKIHLCSEVQFQQHLASAGHAAGVQRQRDAVAGAGGGAAASSPIVPPTKAATTAGRDDSAAQQPAALNDDEMADFQCVVCFEFMMQACTFACGAHRCCAGCAAHDAFKRPPIACPVCRHDCGARAPAPDPVFSRVVNREVERYRASPAGRAAEERRLAAEAEAERQREAAAMAEWRRRIKVEAERRRAEAEEERRRQAAEAEAERRRQAAEEEEERRRQVAAERRRRQRRNRRQREAEEREQQRRREAEEREQQRQRAAQEEEQRRAAKQEEEQRRRAAQEEEHRRRQRQRQRQREAEEREQQRQREAEAEEQRRLVAAQEEERHRRAAQEEEQRRVAAQEEEQRRVAAQEEEQRRLAKQEEQHPVVVYVANFVCLFFVVVFLLLVLTRPGPNACCAENLKMKFS